MFGHGWTPFVVLVTAFIAQVAHSKVAHKTEYSACAVNHDPQYVCCEFKDGKTRILYTRYNRPSGDASYEKFYAEGWNDARQVNFPRADYTPDSPTFKYNDRDSLCSLNETVVIKDGRVTFEKELLCGSSNNNRGSSSTWRDDDWEDGLVFWTHAENARNNNAVPLRTEANCFAVYDDDSKSRCVTDPQQVHVVPLGAQAMAVPFVVLYVFYGAVVVLLILWGVHRHLAFLRLRKVSNGVNFDIARKALAADRRGPGTPQHDVARLSRRTRDGSDVSVDITASTTDTTEVLQTGYRNSGFGTALFVYFVIATLALNVVLVAVIMDYYVVFGTAFIERGDAIIVTFTVVWVVTCVWYIAVVLNKSRIRNFFRLPAKLDRCDFVQLFKADHTEMPVDDSSGISRLVLRMETCCALFFASKSTTSRHGGSLMRGIEQTTNVFYTSQGTRAITFLNLRYTFCNEHMVFEPACIPLARTYHDIYIDSAGLSDEDFAERFDCVGPNTVDINMPSMITSIVDEIFSMFYVYQLMCYYVWFYYKYWNMALVMISVIIVAATVNVYTKRKMRASVIKLTQKSRVVVQVNRNGMWRALDSSNLAPGDLVRVREDCVLPCDMVIIKGSAVCDESMLTGESLPVQKFAIPCTSSELYNIHGHGRRFTLFSGTRVLPSTTTTTNTTNAQEQNELLAIVQTTGVHTTKGKLVQNILFPIPMRFKFDQHFKVLIVLLLVYAHVASYIGYTLLSDNGNTTNELYMWVYLIFMFSGVISPLLPVVITIGQVNGTKRLAKLGIYTLNSKRIPLAGKVRVWCFDKTGTLTKHGLDFVGFEPIGNVTECGSYTFPTSVSRIERTSYFPTTTTTTQRSMRSSSSGNILRTSCCFLPVVPDKELKNPSSGSISKEMLFSLASCHSLGTFNGKLVGSEVEMKMFHRTGWTFFEPSKHNKNVRLVSPDGQYSLEIVKRFEFEHSEMSMSVVVRDMNTDKLYVFVKGSYEKLKSISAPQHVPWNYTKHADELAKNGCYLLAMAMKELPMGLSDDDLHSIVRSRGVVEKDLRLLGLIQFRNELKEDTTHTIRELKEGNARVVMITGDNALTGCYIAKRCGMIRLDSEVILGDKIAAHETGGALSKQVRWKNIDNGCEFSMQEVEQRVTRGDNVELAVTQSAFDFLMQMGEMKRLVLHIRIFSRMSPEGKVDVVRMHMQTGAITGMCGDGGNDCGALRFAHAGIALSDAEASIVSPFSSKRRTIASVVELCKEGRCTLATSFSSIKMLVMNGLIQSFLRYFQLYHGVILAEWQWIILDGIVLVGLSYVLTLSRPLRKLGKQRPTSSLIGTTTMVSMLGQQTIHAAFLTGVIQHLKSQAWYCPLIPETVDMGKWWLISDNHVTTCLFFMILVQQQIAGFVFGFGSRYRRPVWTNYALCALLIALFALDVVFILGPANRLTEMFRISSSTNVVGLPDIPLPFSFRLELFYFVLANILTVAMYEHVVVLGPVRDLIRAKKHKDLIPMKL